MMLHWTMQLQKELQPVTLTRIFEDLCSPTCSCAELIDARFLPWAGTGSIKPFYFSLVNDSLSINFILFSISAVEHIPLRCCVFKKFNFCSIYLTFKYNLRFWSGKEKIWFCGKKHVLSLDIINHGEIEHVWTFILRLMNRGNEIKSSSICRRWW